MKRLMLAVVLATLAMPGWPARAQTNDEAKKETDVVQLKVDVEVLRAENARLRDENAALRKLLGTSVSKEIKEEAVQPAPPAPTNTAPAVSEETNYWLSADGLRHNRHCKFFKVHPGRFCTHDDGKTCKLCKG
jgi:hypothetical protein